LSRKPIKKSDIIGSGPVQYMIGKPGGALSLKVDYSEAPVPPHYYVADYFYVKLVGFRVLIVFGKFDEAGKELRNKLEIYIPVTSFLRQMHVSSREFHQTLREAATKFQFQPIGAGSLDVGLDKNQGKVQSIQSNNVLMAFVDMDCMLDFFYLSPRELHFNPPKRKDIELQALIRVMIDPPTMLGLLNECEIIAKELEAKLPKGQDYDEVESA